MKTIIAGSRGITDPEVVAQAVAASGFPVSEVISGSARGVDSLGEAWAASRGLKVTIVPAAWWRYGSSAGAIRNQIMADMAEALVAIWDGESHGTKDMIIRARKRGLRVHIHNLAEQAQQTLPL